MSIILYATLYGSYGVFLVLINCFLILMSLLSTGGVELTKVQRCFLPGGTVEVA